MPDLSIAIDPGVAALLVMDYQPVVLGSMPDGADLLARAAEAIDIVRLRGGHVGFVRVAFEDADFVAIPKTNKSFFALAGGKYLRADAPETAIHDAVEPKTDDIVVRKTRVGPFSTTDLHEQLKARGVTTLILAGVHTSGVVLSAVRDAADRDYRILLLEDCISDPDSQVHEALMTRVFPRQAHVTSVADLAGLFTSQ
jgi:nicotinamidase-related amidase